MSGVPFGKFLWLFLSQSVLGVGGSFQEAALSDSCTLVVEHLADLGALDDPASVVIPMNVDLAGVPWGGWLVTEDGKEILEYADDGAFRRFFGNRGEGPGELSHPNAVEVDPSDSVWISNRRGRSVVFAPDGTASRTIVDPGLRQITSFTPSGLPMTLLLKVAAKAQPSPSELWPFVQVWNRDLEPIHLIGPGALVSEGPEIMVLGVGNPPQCAVSNDSTLFFPLGGENSFVKWTPTTVDTVPFPDSPWTKLGLQADRKPEPGDRLVALIPDGASGFWGLGAIRRLSEEDEEELVRNAPQPGIQTMDSFKRASAAVRNAVYDGWLGHLTAGGKVTEAVVFEEYPWGFSRPGEFFTFDENENGLVRVRVWKFTRSCPMVGRS